MGELDEEMVYESRVGDVFALGATSWKIEDITHDRVLVSPAFGQPGKLPFWKGDSLGRPVDLGRALGAFVRELSVSDVGPATERCKASGLDDFAANNLIQYLAEQKLATEIVPSDTTLVVERFHDELVRCHRGGVAELGVGEPSCSGRCHVRDRAAGPDRGIEGRDGAVNGVEAVAAATLGRETGGLDLDAAPQLHDRDHPLDRGGAVGLDPERATALVADHEHPGTLAGLHEALGPQRGDRLADHRSADAELAAQQRLGRQ